MKDYVKIQLETRVYEDPPKPPFTFGFLKYETSGRRKPQRESNTFSILDLEGKLCAKTHF